MSIEHEATVIQSSGPVEATGPITVHDLDPVRPGIQRQAMDPSRPAETTFQEDLTMAGQRRVNLIWEYTQAVIAGLVVVSNMIVGTYHGIVPILDGQHRDYPVILSSALFLITGFYFSRTNHAAIGGVGKKPNTPYTGR